MQLSYSNGVFNLKCSVIDNELARRAGFVFSRLDKTWKTPFGYVANRIRFKLDPETSKRLDQVLAWEKYKYEMSKAIISNTEYPVRNGRLKPFQKAGVDYILQTPRCLLADDMGCIDGDAVITVNRAGKTFNVKLADAYNRFNGLDKKIYNWKSSIPTKIRSLCGDRFGQHFVKKIIYSGVKETVTIRLKDGKELRLTPDHEVLTRRGWVEAIKLLEGDEVCINGTKVKRRKHSDGYIYLRGLPIFWDHPRCTTSGLLEHVWLAESLLQRPLKEDEEVHHINHIRDDNRLDNLEILSRKDHAKRHETHKHFKDFTHSSGSKVITVPKFVEAISVKHSGPTDVYDVVMEDPYRNFIANGIVVHNCGKTLQSIVACNALNPVRILIVCPASLVLNWKREWEYWSTIDSEPFVLSYNMLKKNSKEIHKEPYDMLILDECHMLKNSKAQRTLEVFGGMVLNPKTRKKTLYKPIRSERVIALTGTPILNRPVELFNVLRFLSPSGFKDKMDYARRYCDAKKGHFGWDFSGASNLTELQVKLRSTIMIRRMKKDVLFDLPKKQRQIIELDVTRKKSTILSIQEKLFSLLGIGVGNRKTTTHSLNNYKLDEQDYRAVVDSLSNIKAPGFEELSEIRKLTALAKLPLCIDHIRNALSTGEKVVVFCHHKEIVAELYEHFKDTAVKLVGDMTAKQKQKSVDLFQGDNRVKLFIGNLEAAGVGITLTASSIAIFVELDWTPGKVTQAEDRIYRIGQTNKVLIQHLVMANSLDCYMAKMIVAKQEVIESATDDGLSDIEREMLS